MSSVPARSATPRPTLSRCSLSSARRNEKAIAPAGSSRAPESDEPNPSTGSTSQGLPHDDKSNVSATDLLGDFRTSRFFGMMVLRVGRNHEENPIYGRADGQDPGRGGQGAGGRGRQEARGQRGHDIRLAEAIRTT